MTVGPIERISHGQFLWVVMVTMVAGGIYVWPQVALSGGGADWEWAAVAAFLLSALSSRVQLAWARRAAGATYFDRLHAVWGTLAWPWYAVDTAASLALDAMLLALYAQMLETFFYPSLSALPFRLLVGCLAGWFAAQSLPTLARNAQFWMPVVLASFLVLTAVTATQIHFPSALLPPWPPAPAAVAAGTGQIWFLWSEGEVSATLAPWVRGATWRSTARWALAAHLAQASVLAVAAFLVVATLGPWAARVLEWPMIYEFEGLGPTSLSLVRPNMLVIPFWTTAFVLYLAVRLFHRSLDIQSALRLAPAGRIAPVCAFALAIVGATFALPDSSTLLTLLTRDLSPFLLAWSIVRTGATWGLAAVRRGAPAPVTPRP